jgi:Fe-S cluster biosynthesis and repair protein YggX
MVKSTAKSIFIHRESDVWAALQRHQAMLCHSNEQLALKNAEAVDLVSLCAELKDEVAAAHEKVIPLEEEVWLLRGKVAPLEEEVRLLKENLRAMASERDKSRHQATEASLRADSLTRDLEAERS